MVQTVEELQRNEDKKIGEVFATMLMFTALMVLGPISAYFLSKSYIFEGMFLIRKEDSFIYAAITAVFVVHLILAAFIYAAWKDAKSAAIIKKKD